jgi:YVTN family beta-propeller protein
VNRSRSLSAALAAALLATASAAAGQVGFGYVRGSLQAECASCHGAALAEGGLRVDSWEALIRGSSFGEAVIPFDPGHSLMIRLVSGPLEHPADVGGEPLTAGEVSRLRDWVADGARDGAGRVPFDGSRDFLYAANQDAAVVSVIDTEANVVARHVHLEELGFGPNAKPHHIAVAPDGERWYLSLIGANRVLKFDRQNRLLGQAAFEVPGMLALHDSGDPLYVGRSMSAVDPPQRIGRIDTGSMTVEELDVFFPRPHALSLSGDGRYVYSASLGTNQIAAIEPESEQIELTTIEGGRPHAPVQFSLAPDGATLVAATQLSGLLLTYDLGAPLRPELIASVEVGGQPWHPVHTPDGASVYVGNKNANTVTVLDRASGHVRTVRHPGLAQPHGSAVRPDGRYVYVTGTNTRGAYPSRYVEEGRAVGTVVVIDTTRGEVVKVIEVEANPTGLGIRAPG